MSIRPPTAALVLAACELLNARKTHIHLSEIRSGLRTNKWPGRLETVSTVPLIILDGAHNLAAARNLARFLSANIEGLKLTLVIGILDDKPYRMMLKILLPYASRVVLTRAETGRALDPLKLQQVADQLGVDSRIIPNVAAAIKFAIDACPTDGAICIAGSLYVIGEAKAAMEKGKFFP